MLGMDFINNVRIDTVSILKICLPLDDDAKIAIVMINQYWVGKG
jgi:hypothetical protein